MTLVGIGSSTEQVNPTQFSGFNPPTTNAQFQIPSDDPIEVYFITEFLPLLLALLLQVMSQVLFLLVILLFNCPAYPQIYGFKVSIVDETGVLHSK